jgi:septum formation protein
MLSQLGFLLRIRPARTDESVHPGEGAAAYVRRVAREKARAVDGDFVLAADTAVVLAGRVLGKPSDRVEAARMLRGLSGTSHEVLTGVCLRRVAARIELEALVATEVAFAPLGEAEIAWYVSTGEPLDKAGAYAVQGAGGAFVREVRGSVSNVVGLPLAETVDLLRRAGYPLPWETR